MIQVKVDTSGYGGKMIREAVRVRTNDPERPYLGLAVTGFVELFARLSKKHVRLLGQGSDRLSGQVLVTPREEYPFKIKDVEAKDGRYISFSVREEVKDGNRRYVVTVDNIRKEKGTYADVINIYTDSRFKKVIPIYVVGDIRETK